MREYEFELAVGDSLLIDDQILTVVDIDGEDISFRLEELFPDRPEDERPLRRPPR